jgi:hypothetical protein
LNNKDISEIVVHVFLHGHAMNKDKKEGINKRERIEKRRINEE